MTRFARVFTITSTAAAALFVALPQAAVAATPATSTASRSAAGARSPLEALILRRLSDPRLGRDVQITVTDAESGETLVAYRSEHRMTAASNMKIITGVNALATLGPSARLTTRVLQGATPSDVILQGVGDPLLSASQVRSLAARTARALPRGQQVIVHVDGDLFAHPSKAPGWSHLGSANSNGQVQALAIRGDRGAHPSLNAARVFVKALTEHGVPAHAGRNQDAAVDAQVLAQATGHSVAQAVGAMLSTSDSGVAETLFRLVAVGRHLPATWTGARRAALESLAELGLDTAGLVLADGSGLSRSDRITSAFLVSLLRVARVTQRPRFLALFARTALPVAGRTGTLAQSFGRYDTYPSRCASGRVQAKTGTIPGTIALSGIARPKHGHERIFSIIVNHRPVRFRTLDSRRALDGLAATIQGCWRR